MPVKQKLNYFEILLSSLLVIFTLIDSLQCHISFTKRFYVFFVRETTTILRL